MNREHVERRLRRMAEASGAAAKRHVEYQRLHRDADVPDAVPPALPEQPPPPIGRNS